VSVPFGKEQASASQPVVQRITSYLEVFSQAIGFLLLVTRSLMANCDIVSKGNTFPFFSEDFKGESYIPFSLSLHQKSL
jgi:hypothetical protein